MSDIDPPAANDQNVAAVPPAHPAPEDSAELIRNILQQLVDGSIVVRIESAGAARRVTDLQRFAQLDQGRVPRRRRRLRAAIFSYFICPDELPIWRQDS